MPRTASPLLLPLFRSAAQARLLARVYLQADRPAPLAELAHELGNDRGGVKREADRLEAAGLVLSERVGRQRLLKPNRESPYYGDLYGLLLTAFGPAALVGPALRDVPGIEEAYLFGSWAARYSGEAGSDPVDIDVLLVGSPDRTTVYAVASELEALLRREVNPIIVSRERWDAEDEGFIREVKGAPLVKLERHDPKAVTR
ncbi:MAG: ArsR family transcriptional regulator [Actinobacteria bacterium]|nr:ArsR family transcriptional regulator [Actinomycetota bacterium]